MSSPPEEPRRQLLSRRWVYRTLREVVLEDGRHVVKRFVHHAGRHDRRRVWELEDHALRRLEGLPVPRSLGYRKGRCADGPEYVLRKEYICGSPLAKPAAADAADMGRLLAAIHQRCVVTGDPALANFLRTPEGELYFIDFGRSRIFGRRSPLFYAYVGKELARCSRTGLPGRADLWAAFREAYDGAFPLHPAWRRLVDASFRYWLRRWRDRPFSRPPGDPP